MSMDVKGTLVQILKLEEGVSKAGKAWSKQDFVIETNEQYPKKVCFTLFGEKVSLIDGISEGSEVEVFFNLESRDFNGKWYHNINAWKINAEQGSTSQGSVETGLKQIEDVPPTQDAADDSGNDLPF